jgi:hypothetical protein
MSATFSDALAGLPERRSCHDPGRVLVDVAVMLADGGEAISDLAVLRDQPGLARVGGLDGYRLRVLDGIDEQALTRLRTARAVALERAWLLRAEAGRDLPASSAGGTGWGWSWTWTPEPLGLCEPPRDDHRLRWCVRSPGPTGLDRRAGGQPVGDESARCHVAICLLRTHRGRPGRFSSMRSTRRLKLILGRVVAQAPFATSRQVAETVGLPASRMADGVGGLMICPRVNWLARKNARRHFLRVLVPNQVTA